MKMRYEEPNMELLQLGAEVVVTSNLNDNTGSKNDEYEMPDSW